MLEDYLIRCMVERDGMAMMTAIFGVARFACGDREESDRVAKHN